MGSEMCIRDRYRVVRIVYQVRGLRVDTLHLPDLPGQLAHSCIHVPVHIYVLRSMYIPGSIRTFEGVISGICILRFLETCLSANEPVAADRYRNF